jgi:hypothetical protein
MSIQVVTLPRFDFADRINIEVGEGASIADMIAQTLPAISPAQYGLLRVTINDAVVEPRHFNRIRPKVGTCVIIRMALHGDNLRSVLSLAVTVAAIAVGQLYLGPLLANSAIGGLFGSGITGYGAASATAGTIGLFSAASTLAVSIGGSLLLNALIPPAQSGQIGGDKNLQSIQGLQNNLSPNGAVPLVLGFFRYAPPYACQPRTEIVDNDQYVSAAVVCGHGELDISELKLGETPIDDYVDVEHETFTGTASDPPMSYCSTQILETALGIQLLSNQSNVRVTASDITAFSVDILFPQGLIAYDSKGKGQTAGVTQQVRYRKVGDADWITDTVQTFGKSQDPTRRTLLYAVPERGRYEVDMVRLSPDYDATEDKIFARSDWTLLRSHRPEYPINFEFPIALSEVRIKATDQLNGVVNNINAIVKSIVPDFNGTSWVRRVSNNPASLYRYVLQCAANAYPVPDSGIILSDIEDWHAFCVDKGLTYNGVRDSSAALLDVLADVAAAGRAAPQIIGGKWTVVVDRPQTQLISAISPRNSSGFAGSIDFPVYPDGYRVQFFDEENGYESTERVIPWPGVDPADVRVTEDLSLPGKTNAGEIYREARRRQYEAIYLRENYTVTQDIEGLVFTRGDLTAVSHDVLDRTQVAARIRTVRGNLVEIDDAVIMEEGASYGARVRKASGDIVQFAVATMPGETQIVQLVGSVAGSGIDVGDLLMFGTTSQITTNCRVKSIDRGDNLSVNLGLVPYMPIIDELTDATVIPPWDGRFGEVIPLTAPGVPTIASVETIDGNIVVHIASGGGATALTYTVGHRISGGGSYTETSAAAGAGGVVVTGYAAGDVVDLKVKAIGIGGGDSGYGAVTTYATHIGPTFDSTFDTFDSATLTWDSV